MTFSPKRWCRCIRCTGVALGARTADCVPVLLHDPAGGVIDRMRLRFGTNPADVVALVGPAIGSDSFQVGREVVDAFEAAGIST